MLGTVPKLACFPSCIYRRLSCKKFYVKSFLLFRIKHFKINCFTYRLGNMTDIFVKDHLLLFPLSSQDMVVLHHLREVMAVPLHQVDTAVRPHQDMLVARLQVMVSPAPHPPEQVTYQSVIKLILTKSNNRENSRIIFMINVTL